MHVIPSHMVTENFYRLQHTDFSSKPQPLWVRSYNYLAYKGSALASELRKMRYYEFQIYQILSQATEIYSTKKRIFSYLV